MQSFYFFSRSKSRKRSALETASPFGTYLSEVDLAKLAKLCTIVSFSAGREVDGESPFYLVLEGTVAVLDGASGTELTTRKAGAFFTRHAGRGQVSRRSQLRAGSSTLVGRSAGSLLLARDEERLQLFYENLSSEARDGYDAIISTNISTVLSEVNFISEAKLDATALRQLGELCSYTTVRAGDTVFAQGDKPDSFYIVVKGKVETIIDEKALTGSADAAEGEIGGLAKVAGETFGVAALVLGADVRQYSMVTHEGALLIRVSFADFKPFLEEHTTLEACLLHSTKLFLLQRYSTMPSSIFSTFDREEIELAASVATFDRYKAGQVVYALGDEPEAFYVVTHGEVQRKYKDGSAAKTLRVGTYFGEVGVLLPDTRCFATVTASVESTLLTISKEDFAVICPLDGPSRDTQTSQRVSSVSSQGGSTPHRGSPGMRRSPSMQMGAARAATAMLFNSGGARRPPTAGSGPGKGGRRSPASPMMRLSPAAAMMSSGVVSITEERNLRRTLVAELLIKLQRSDVSLGVLLLHPRAHRELIEFALRELKGALRLDVHNVAASLLQRVRIALESDSTLSTNTTTHMKEYLESQAKTFALEHLRRNPCVNVDPAEPLFARVAEAEAQFVKTFGQQGSSTLRDLSAALSELWANYMEVRRREHLPTRPRPPSPKSLNPKSQPQVSTPTAHCPRPRAFATCTLHLSRLMRPWLFRQVVKIGHAKYIASTEFQQLLERMGAYAEGVAPLVGDAVSEIAARVEEGHLKSCSDATIRLVNGG